MSMQAQAERERQSRVILGDSAPARLCGNADCATLSGMTDRPLLVRDVMTADPVFIAPDATVEQAHALMTSGGFRHLPVVDGKRVVGVISTGDIGRLGPTIPELTARPVADLMSADPPTVAPEQPIEAAAGQMGLRKVNCLPVVSEGRLVGIVTTYDLLDALALYFGPKSVRSPER